MSGDQIDDFFGDLSDVPGKRKPIGREKPKKPSPEQAPWDDKPRHYYMKGVKTQFFTISQVGRALNYPKGWFYLILS